MFTRQVMPETHSLPCQSLRRTSQQKTCIHVSDQFVILSGMWNVSSLIFSVCFQKSAKSTTWSNSPVDISLDNLSPMSHRDKPAQPSMNELYSNQQQLPSATMGLYGTPQHMYAMGGVPPMNSSVPMMGMAPQINMLSANMNQMTVSSNIPMMQMTNKGMGMMQPRPMGQMQGFNGSGYSTYKGVS